MKVLKRLELEEYVPRQDKYDELLKTASNLETMFRCITI
jgi:hypothetical protein